MDGNLSVKLVRYVEEGDKNMVTCVELCSHRSAPFDEAIIPSILIVVDSLSSSLRRVDRM